MRRRLLSSILLIAVLAAALAAAPWPEGEVTSEDRDLVARPRRVGTVRLDADAGHGPDDAADPALATAPIDRLDLLTAATAPPLVAVAPSTPRIGSPASERLVRVRPVRPPLLRRPGHRPRARAPPAAA